MLDAQPPTQPKAFAVSTTAPTQPKNFNRLPPTGPRLVPTPGPPHPQHQSQILETSPTPVPTRPDPGPTTAGAPAEEEPEIKLPKIQEFTLPNPHENQHRNQHGNQHGNQPKKDTNPFTKLDKTVNISHHMRYRISDASRRLTSSCEKVI